MRPKFAMWSNYEAPTRKHWRSPSRRGPPRASIGAKILLAAVLVMGAGIGISAIEPQVIDAEWDEDAPTHLLQVPVHNHNPTKRRSGIVAAIPLPPPRSAITTGEATTSSSPYASSPELLQLGTVAAIETLTETEESPAVAEIPDAKARTYAPPPETAPVLTAKPGKKLKVVVVAVKRKVEHQQRSYARAYAQYGGWGGWNGGWPGFSPSGNFRRF